MELFTYFFNEVKADKMNVVKWIDLLTALKAVEEENKIDAEYMINELLNTYPINERTALVILKSRM